MIIDDKSQADAYDKISQELRRGVLILAVLSQLQVETHGYALISTLAEHGFLIDQGTLYPLLRRLESQGLLQSQWNTEGARPRRYYVLTAAGATVLQTLHQDWQHLTVVMQRLFSKQEEPNHGVD